MFLKGTKRPIADKMARWTTESTDSEKAKNNVNSFREYEKNVKEA